MTENEAKDILTLNDDMKQKLPNLKEVYEVAIKALEDVRQYRAIGTVEECREAMEKQRAKKSKVKVQDRDLKIGCVIFKAGTKIYWCPSCRKSDNRFRRLL